MKTLYLVVFTLTFSLFSPALAEGEVAYVDLQRALLETNEGKKAKAALEKMKKERQKKLDKRQNKLKEDIKNFQAQSAIMAKDVREKKQVELMKQEQELRVTYANLQKELAVEEAKRTNKLVARMLKIVTKLGKKRKYAAVLERKESGVLWAPSKHDLTNEVIRKFDAGEGK